MVSEELICPYLPSSYLLQQDSKTELLQNPAESKVNSPSFLSYRIFFFFFVKDREKSMAVNIIYGAPNKNAVGK